MSEMSEISIAVWFKHDVCVSPAFYKENMTECMESSLACNHTSDSDVRVARSSPICLITSMIRKSPICVIMSMIRRSPVCLIMGA